MTKILISDAMSEEGVNYLQSSGSFEVLNLPGLSPADLLDRVQDADALIVRSKTKVTPEVIDGSHSVVYQEAENRLHVQKALLALVV